MTDEIKYQVSPYAIPGIIKFRRKTKRDSNEVKVDKLIKNICDFFSIEPESINKTSRKREVVYARKWCCFFCVTYTKLSLKLIAAKVGVKDHTSVIYHKNDVLSQIDVEYLNDFKEDYIDLMKCAFYGVDKDNGRKIHRVGKRSKYSEKYKPQRKLSTEKPKIIRPLAKYSNTDFSTKHI